MLQPGEQLEDATFIAFDTETTGLYPVAARLLEIGAVRFTLDGQEIAVFEQLINPETMIPLEAQQVNHITDEMVRDQPTIATIMPAFLDFLGSPDNSLIAQNAAFDIGFIGVGLMRLGLALPAHIVFDTKLLAQAVIPGLATYSLISLATALGTATKQEHRALDDAWLSKDVFLALLRRVPNVKTVGDLCRLAPPLTFGSSRIYEVKPPPGFEDLGTAIDTGRSIVMVYEGGTKGSEPRHVTPRALLGYGGTVYLAAFCHADSKEKMYRIDRIKRFLLAT